MQDKHGGERSSPPYFKHLKTIPMSQKVKFKRDYKHEAIGANLKKAPSYTRGSTHKVTDKMAAFLEKIGVATIVLGKGDKEADSRETK